VGPAEIDFIAQKNMKTVYYQVSLTILDEATRRRELEPLEKVDDSYPKILLTLDSLPQSDHKGIVIKNVVDWLLEEEDVFEPCRGGILTRIPQPKAVRRADALAGVSSRVAEKQRK
jgi:hypothetical protein